MNSAATQILVRTGASVSGQAMGYREDSASVGETTAALTVKPLPDHSARIASHARTVVNALKPETTSQRSVRVLKVTPVDYASSQTKPVGLETPSKLPSQDFLAEFKPRFIQC